MPSREAADTFVKRVTALGLLGLLLWLAFSVWADRGAEPDRRGAASRQASTGAAIAAGLRFEDCREALTALAENGVVEQLSPIKGGGLRMVVSRVWWRHLTYGQKSGLAAAGDCWRSGLADAVGHRKPGFVMIYDNMTNTLLAEGFGGQIEVRAE